MIAIEDKLISRDVVEKEFVCNLGACKGACCVLGDEGAPLEPEEVAILENIFEKVKPYITEKGIKAVEEQGKHVPNPEGQPSTTLIDGQACAYIHYDEKGIALCGIEVAHKAGAVDFKKPVSCHLYPIRVKQFDGFEAVNYDRWEICKPACTLGSELKVPVYKFLKEPLIRKYGESFYTELDRFAQHLDAPE